MKKPSATNRREFLFNTTLVASLLGISPSLLSNTSKEDILTRISQPRPASGKPVMGLRVDPMQEVRVGFIGLGNRGSGHVRQIHAIAPKAKIVAICDIRESKAKKSSDWLKEKGITPTVYSGKADAWKKMIERDDIDLVIISTPWKDHVPMCVEAMRAGKHVAVEVPAAMSVEGCWDLVNTAEETQRHCIMLENVCYGDEELWVLNMVEEGIFGTLTYAEAAYIHNLREHLFSKDYYYNQWRIRHHVEADGNLYPTHGLGPVAQYLSINRGDRFNQLVSMSSLQASLSDHSTTVDSDNEFYNRQEFQHGDMNNTLIKTANGRTILVQHDVVTPRPYSRINALAGTEAYHEGYPSRLSVNGKGHGWLASEEYQEWRTKYKHPIWTELKEAIEKNGGHGGMDFVMLYRLIDCLNKGLPLDMDVYDGADWSVVTPLSELSVQLGSVPIQFPDFTRGKWKGKRALGIMANIG